MIENISTKTENKSNKYIIFMLALILISSMSGISGDPFQSMISAGVGGGLFAAVCLNKFKIWTVLPMAILPPVLSYALSPAIENNILSLSFLPVGIAVYYGIKKGHSRSQTITGAVALISIFYGGVYAYYVSIIYGSPSGENILKFIDLCLKGIRTAMDLVREMYAQSGLEVDKLLPTELLDATIASLRVSWLGYALAIFGIMCFIATAIAKKCVPSKTEFEKKNGNWSFVLSKSGAIVFILAYIVGSVYSASKDGLYLLLATNTIFIGMCPAVIYMGVSKVLQRLRTGRKMLTLILLLIALSFGTFAFLFLMIIGVYSTLLYKDENVDESQKNQ